MSRKLKVDFTDVESYVRCEEGQHVAVVKEITEQPAKESGNEMLVAKFEVVKGSSTGAIVYNNFVLIEKSLWRLKGFLEAVGFKADGKVAFDLDKLVGKKLVIEVKHEEYKGQDRARIEEYMPFAASKAKPVDDEDEDDYEDDDEEEEEKPAKKKSKATPPPAKSKKKPVEEDDEDEEEDEEEAPPKKKKKPEAPPAKKSAPAKKKRPADDDDDDEDEDWEDD